MQSSLKKWLLKSFTFLSIFFAISLFIFFFFKAHQQKQSETILSASKNHPWLEKFFHDLMLEEDAIYTLHGSKPITRIIIYHYTDEQIQAYYDALTEEEKKECFIIEEPYDLLENWEKWKKISSQFPFKHYLLFESNWYDEPDITFLYFVDTVKTIDLLQRHYQTFRNIIEFDFDPKQVVFEMQNKSSPFWDKVQGCSLLWGLLFGYGEENATIFHKKFFECEEALKPIYESIPQKPSNEPLRGIVVFDLNHFQIPSFISFEKDDKTINQYKKERETIKRIYKGQDFLVLTLQKLTSN